MDLTPDPEHILKIWAAATEPEFDEDVGSWSFLAKCSIDDDEEVFESFLWFQDKETAVEVKHELDTTFEPIEKPIKV